MGVAAGVGYADVVVGGLDEDGVGIALGAGFFADYCVAQGG